MHPLTVHGSHDTIHTFKNYFATVFSVFSFSNNKFNSNRPYSICLDPLKLRFTFTFLFFFFFFLAHISGAKRLLFMHYLWTVTTTFNQVFRGQCICSWTHKLHFSATFSIKMSPMVLFTHLKFILLQYFQFSVSAK